MSKDCNSKQATAEKELVGKDPERVISSVFSRSCRIIPLVHRIPRLRFREVLYK